MNNGSHTGPWRVYVSPRKGLRLTRRIIPPAELRKGERLVATFEEGMSREDAEGYARMKYGTAWARSNRR